MKLKDLKLKSVGYLINLGIRMLYDDHHGFVFNANCGTGFKRSLSAGRTESIASKLFEQQASYLCRQKNL